MKMKKTKKQLLQKMFITEKCGEIFYNVLATKADGLEEQEIYQRLEDNERNTALLIERTADKGDYYVMADKNWLYLSKFVLRLFTKKRLLKILAKLLRKKVYQQYHRDGIEWFDAVFWGEIKKHENLQRELLNL